MLLPNPPRCWHVCRRRDGGGVGHTACNLRRNLRASCPPGMAAARAEPGWRQGAAEVPLLTLTVKQATQIQLAPAYDALRARHLAFIQEAYSGAAPPVEAIYALRAALARLWAQVWEPQHKEALWRLAVHGVTGFGMHAALAAEGRAET